MTPLRASSGCPTWKLGGIDAGRSVAFDESDRLGPFDASLRDEWHASTQEGCGSTASTLPTITIPTSSVTSITNVTIGPTLTHEGLPFGHSISDSSDDEDSSKWGKITMTEHRQIEQHGFHS
jgi:hypothetical protein